MYRQSMQIGIVLDRDRIPAGWHFWETVTPARSGSHGPEPTSVVHPTYRRIMQHTEWLQASPSHGATLHIVRAVPDTPPHGLAGICRGPWPVTADDLAAESARMQHLGLTATEADVRFWDPYSGYARSAPLSLDEARSTMPGAASLHSGQYMGRVRFYPDRDAWAADIGWGSTVRTLPGGPAASAASAARELIERLAELYCSAARELAADCGGVATWILYPPRGIHVRVVWLEQADTGTKEHRLLETWLRVRYADLIPIRPVDGLEWWLGTTGLICPDCLDGTIRWAEAGSVPGARRCYHCGGHWLVARQEINGVDWHVLRRADDSQLGEIIDDPSEFLERCQHVEVPDRERLVAEARELRLRRRAERRAETQRCLELLRQQLPPAVAALLNDRGFRPRAELRLANGDLVRFRGPVRLRERQHGSQRDDVVLAQVEIIDPPQRSGKSVWLAIAEFI